MSDVAITGLEHCEVCGEEGCELFGYRSPEGWHWYCGTHRPWKFYADRHLPALSDPDGDREEVLR
jgi:hypothetical protein